MAAGLAHEIRNPLGAIKGAVQVMQPSMKQQDPHTEEFLGVIVEEVDRLNRVVTQFLSYSRPFKGEIGQVDLAHVVQDTVRLIDPERLERLHVDVPDDLPPVRGDAEALRQVFLNLLMNALDAIEDPLASREGEDPARVWIDGRLRPRGLPDGDAVGITVRDNGPGLSQQTLSTIFVPFHTTKTGGTGLGLPICQRIVENHRGVILVGNNVEGGASFTVVLPVERSEKPS
jgi:signal transduction histidine kinase